MTSNVIFIEGLPGSGKTTFAKRLQAHLANQGYQTELYQEGDLHPIDLSWCSLMTKDEYQEILKQYPRYKDQIEHYTKKNDDLFVTAYTKLKVDKSDKDIYQAFGAKEIYQGIPLGEFKDIHHNLYKAFAKSYNPTTVYIFECVFIQNHINELILKHDLSAEDMITYFNDLIGHIKDLHPLLVHIEQQDVRKTITSTAQKRRSSDPQFYPHWMDAVVSYIEEQPKAKQKGYMGEEGSIQYFIDRAKLQEKIVQALDIDVYRYLLATDYDYVFNRLSKDITDKLSE